MVNSPLANLVAAAYAPVVARLLEPNPLWDALLPEDIDCPYPLQGAVNVPLFGREEFR